MEQWLLLLKTEFTRLNHEHQRVLFNSFRSFAYQKIGFLIKDHVLIEDVIQEAFLKATTKSNQIKKTSSMKQWVSRVIRNTALDAIKKSKKYSHTLDLEKVLEIDLNEVHSQTSVSVEETIETRLCNQALHDSILELKYEYRLILWMHHIEEKPIRLIAQELGINEQAVAQRLVRARKKLLCLFSKKWNH